VRAIQTSIELAPNEAREVIFLLGEAESKEAAQSVVAIPPAGNVNAAFEKVLAHWDELLGTIEVRHA
jgi:cyclic beta-1,2-glucan synthetase